MKINLCIGTITLTATLNESETAKKIVAILPLEGHANVWGEEIYFEIPIQIDLEDGATEEVEVRTLAYWPTGRAFCIFFGPTPASINDKPRAYSPVNVFGNIDGDATALKDVTNGTQIKVTTFQGPTAE